MAVNRPALSIHGADDQYRDILQNNLLCTERFKPDGAWRAPTFLFFVPRQSTPFRCGSNRHSWSVRSQQWIVNNNLGLPSNAHGTVASLWGLYSGAALALLGYILGSKQPVPGRGKIGLAVVFAIFSPANARSLWQAQGIAYAASCTIGQIVPTLSATEASKPLLGKLIVSPPSWIIAFQILLSLCALIAIWAATTSRFRGKLRSRRRNFRPVFGQEQTELLSCALCAVGSEKRFELQGHSLLLLHQLLRCNRVHAKEKPSPRHPPAGASAPLIHL